MKKTLLFLLLLVPFAGFSQFIHNVKVQRSTTGAATGMEVIADMSLVHRPAFLLSHSSNLHNDTLFLKACYYEGIQTTPVQFTDTFQVGNLPLGTFTLHFTMIKSHNHLQCDSIGSYIKLQSFTVNQVTGVKPAEETDKISFYPNPVTDVFHIAGNNHQFLNLYDLRGRLVKRYVFGAKNSASQVSVADLPKGIYLAELISLGGEIYRMRLLKN